MSLSQLSQSQSRIPSPISRYGYAIARPETKTIVYDGQPLPKFLLDHGADPSSYPEFLKLNRIGSAFEELQVGRVVTIPDPNNFLAHPEA
ncbi:MULTISPECIES: hypothetical protein [Trichocoleus]|uniref:LysM domain-containing protein n=1 Tax=Trichocoleus desertorum GB2-A4 TaxID=2933944 RepID=A0ABV0JCM1_9CYAN|nr:hypothetical protein [Trichocoleus sp. FACHB-46]MBD1864183.1 hypothetical protein [Trichocoleus sp. FACHB-46]